MIRVENKMSVWRYLSVLIFAFSLLSCEGEDPLEPYNRPMFEFNAAIDRAVLRPSARVYNDAIDANTQAKIANITANLNEPLNAANHLLQGDIESSAVSLGRFLVNSTMGLLGSYDFASTTGTYPRPTSFNQTLAKWGVSQGPYIVLPFLGPNTVRGSTGLFIDSYASSRLTDIYAIEGDTYSTYMLLSRLNDRARYDNIIDILLYQSPDSYTTSRIAFLQNQQALEQEAQTSDNEDTVELENFYEFDE